MCSKKIASDKDRFFYKDQTEFQFKNPDGYIFDIITFGTADGCSEQGKTTMEFTWFPGHSWKFALCSRCGLHLGWKYSRKFSFYGLMKPRLIKVWHFLIRTCFQYSANIRRMNSVNVKLTEPPV